MNTSVYSWGISLIALAQIINSLAGAVMIYFIDNLPIDVFELFSGLICLGAVIFLIRKNLLLASLTLFTLNVYVYWNNYNWGVTGFSIGDQHIQPLVTVWLAMFAMAFCIIGGVYLILKRTTPKT